ncbi:drug/metabolite transporter permease [Klebsiella pneumoniae]|uniref:Drug/metabolite transporter permease n=1 Tax=Klebsiella pneumoniae TaxID=573 RepID=A0A2X3CQ73_KLEPN|nr:drug/metabolite transporter permease [Klebsiella pneumoniae]
MISRLSSWQLACLIFCGLNTLVGYGALAEAMARWQAAQGQRVNHLDATVYATVF